MSSETDQPRQRTVAELLAQHGGNDAASTGRRRRRRDPADPTDDSPDQPGAAPAAGAPASPPWPQSHPPNPERATGQPPTALGGSAHEPGGWDAPRPPAALPQQYAPPSQHGAGQHGAGQHGAGQHGPGQNGAGPRNGAPRQPAPAPWGGATQANPARPGAAQQQAWSDRSEPQRRNPPATGWERPGPARPEQAQRPGAPWDARPWDTGSTAAAPEQTRSGPLPVPPDAAGADRGFREPPPRAFAPGPEPVRSAPPFAASPHAGSAPLPAGANPFGPPPGFGGRPGDPGVTGPIDAQRLQALNGAESTSRVQSPLPPGRPPGADDGGPATAVGLPPAGAEDWHRRRTGQGQPGPDADGGPPTQASAPMDFDDYDDIDSHPAGLAPARPDRDTEGRGSHEFDGAFEDGPRPDGDDAGDPEKADQSWAPVLAQWVIGAIGGAALWVGFRFLWSSLLVVAIAAAVLVTVGLVIVVRTLLRNTDLRTTLAAVAVGILLTVSPAVLVLLGR